jgi:hypothetical protein
MKNLVIFFKKINHICIYILLFFFYFIFIGLGKIIFSIYAFLNYNRNRNYNSYWENSKKIAEKDIYSAY